MIDIERILGSHKEVFADSGVLLSPGFLWNLYDIKNFENLDRGFLLDEIERVKSSIRFFSYSKIRTTPEVAEEIRQYAGIISEKARYLSLRFALNRHRSCNGKVYVSELSTPKDSSLKIELINELQEKTYEYYETAKRKRVKIKDPRFKILVEMVKDASITCKLKKDYSPSYGMPEKDPYRSDCDERLASAVFWTMITKESESLALISCDTDFMRFFGAIPWFLGSDDFLPFNHLFKEKVFNGSFTLYVINPGDSDEFLPISEYKIEELKGYGLGRVEPEDLAALKQRLSVHWKEFCEG